MKTRTKFLSLIFGTTIATSAIIAPSIALSSCSNGSDSSNGTGNNNQGGNGSNNPATPLPQADTSNITTFAEALQFTNKYLKENYKLENFRDDFKKSINPFGELISLSQNGDQFNCVYNMFSGLFSTSNGVIDPTPTYKIELFNIKVNYGLCWVKNNNRRNNNQFNNNLTPLTPYLMTTFSIPLFEPDYSFDTLPELEAKHPNYKTETWGVVNYLDQNGNIVRKCYFLSKFKISNNNKIFWADGGCPALPIAIQGIFSFYNIPEAEIQANLYQPPKPQPPRTRPQP